MVQNKAGQDGKENDRTWSIKVIEHFHQFTANFGARVDPTFAEYGQGQGNQIRAITDSNNKY